MNASIPTRSALAAKAGWITVLILGAVLAWMALAPSPALAAATITVDSTADTNAADSVLTLREAILLANGGVGGDGVTSGTGRGLEEEEADNLAGLPGSASVDAIVFSNSVFPAGNAGTINLGGTLPAITGGNDAIDGTGRGVWVDGGASPAFQCIVVNSSSNIVKGLGVTDCTNGIQTNLAVAHSNTIGPGNVLIGNINGVSLGGDLNTVKGNYIGILGDGSTISTDTYNSGSGVVVFGDNNVIGGETPADRNIVSGNNIGIKPQLEATGNSIKGNYIGTDVTGTLSRGNLGQGVVIYDDNNTVGGSTVGARNIISSNSVGIELLVGANQNTIRGNYVGTDVTGTLDRGNIADGVLVRSGSNWIGGIAAGEGNLISGNNNDGVSLFQAQATYNAVVGNRIGTNATGTSAIANTANGVDIQGSNNQVGGSVPGAPNVISGNFSNGIRITGDGTVVVGNLVGTNAAGDAPLGNGNQGIRIENAVNTSVTNNLVGGSGDVGIRLEGTNLGTTIKSNRVGTDATATLDLGNQSHGIHVGSSSVTVGGNTDADGNLVARNDGNGIYVASGSGGLIARNIVRDNALDGIHSTGGEHRFTRNTFSGNGGLGINLDGGTQLPSGVTLNDATDADSGPNSLQNYPAIDWIDLDTMSVIHGTFQGAPNAAITIEFFYGPSCDASGYGEGGLFLGQGNIMTDGAGQVTFALPVSTPPALFTPTQYLAATATSAANTTSEMSGCRAVFAIDDDNDGILDASDNCPNWPNPAQNLPLWTVPANDSDCDGFTAAAEAHVGTDPTTHCNATAGFNDEPDFWPGDFNDNKIVNLPDVVSFGPTFNKLPGQPGYNQRYDLNMSNITNLADIVAMGPYFNRTCG